jgi:ADP-L-glycero-D-manno-heptose 6-epimerase
MIIVTGGAGFIGSQLLLQLNKLGYEDILVVDDLTDGRKFKNLSHAATTDYLDYEKFLTYIQQEKTFSDTIEGVFHQGACSNTTEWNGRYMMENNYEYSKTLLSYCLKYHIPMIYASSASVYGTHAACKESKKYEHPLNIYGYSKLLFDRYVEKLLPTIDSQVVGLRYFNVYGPHEDFKESMASVVWHLMNQLTSSAEIKLFDAYGGYAPGEQKRDFVFVKDIVDVNAWFLEHPNLSGIYNCGTGQASTFNSLAHTLLKLHGKGELKYIPFPEHLKGHYQSFTQADLTKLRHAGYSNNFTSLQDGIAKYYDYFLESLLCHQKKIDP